MFAWLAHASEDVWYDCVERVNPDDDTWLLLWMVDQPQCTEQLAAHIFWWSGPAHVAEHLFGGGSLNPNDESDMLIDLILRNWRKDLYRKGEIGFDGPNDCYRAMLAKYAPRLDPLDVPQGLFSRFDGRKRNVDPNETPEINPSLWELYSDVGLSSGPRPESSGQASPRPPHGTPQHGISQSAQNPPRALGIALLAVSLVGMILWFKFVR